MKKPKDVTPANRFTILGADVSSLQRALELGAKYYDENGNQGDPLQILKDHGVHYIRLRVWVKPTNGYNNKLKVIQFAKSVKAMEMKLLINLHYSDRWTDPDHQAKPAAWAAHPFDQLQADVYEYTYDICNSLKVAGVTPDMIQIGNEINNGVLLPDGSTSNWDDLAALLRQGYNAAKACSPSIQVMLHIADAGNKEGAFQWFDNAKFRGVEWDISGLSYYSFWHGTMSAMKDTVKEMTSNYGKPVIIAETAYPFTLEENDDEKNVVNPESQMPLDYPVTPAGQASNLKAVLDAARAGGAIGLFYWEPTWTAVRGNGWDPDDTDSGCQWENQALFDFEGKALPAMSVFKV
jgi:arabinogalactan endo-1,4-beta-galactosidase